MILTFTSEEREAIRKRGYSFTSCRICKEETIYSPKAKVPKTCGMAGNPNGGPSCGEQAGEEWAERE